MAKGQKRSNREIRKPKQPKATEPVKTSPFAAALAKPEATGPGKKK